MSTDSKKTPSQLAAYADLFDRLLDCTLLLEPETQLILEANVACERVLGQSNAPEPQTAAFVGRPLLDWVDPECREDVTKALRIAMRRYYPRQFDTRFKLPDGRVIHMDVLACPLGLADGRQVLQIIARDVTFRREAEAKMKDLLARLEVLSSVDEMTGLFNFRQFKSELQKEHLRSHRFATPYAIVFCDVDHFKHYNDRNGHPAGDRLLKEFAVTVQRTCRGSDVVARYGGEEFAVICPGIDAKGAQVLAERIRNAINETAFEFGEFQPLGRLTVSIGVSSYPDHGRSPDQVLKAADDAVYRSKTNGRNCVTVASYSKKLTKKVS